MMRLLFWPSFHNFKNPYGALLLLYVCLFVLLFGCGFFFPLEFFNDNTQALKPHV